jgi:hypothetical protein
MISNSPVAPILLALIGADDELLRHAELPLVNAAKPQDAHTLYQLQTVPGIGKSLSLVQLYLIQQIDRCPRVQDLALPVPPAQDRPEIRRDTLLDVRDPA